MLNELSGIIDTSRQKEKGGRIQDGRHRYWGFRLSATGWHHSVSSRCAAAVAKKMIFPREIWLCYAYSVSGQMKDHSQGDMK